MSEHSVREAEAQILRDYAAVVGSVRRTRAALMFAVVSNGARYKLYKLSSVGDGLLRMEMSEIFNIATADALVQLAVADSQWCASFRASGVGASGAGAAGAGAAGAGAAGAGAAGAGVDSDADAVSADAVAFAVALERIVRHLISSIDADSHLPTVKTNFVVPDLAISLPDCSVTVGDVLAVTWCNVVALCEVKWKDEAKPAEQCVIKMRFDRTAHESVQAEVDGVKLCQDLFERFPNCFSRPPPKVLSTLLGCELLYEHVKGVPISECCTCSAAKREHLRNLLLRDIAPFRKLLAANKLLYIDWHSGNVLVDDAQNPTKLFLVDFESLIGTDGKRRTSPLIKVANAVESTVDSDWVAADERNWKELLNFN
jgi:hypothetical protein